MFDPPMQENIRQCVMLPSCHIEDAFMNFLQI